MGAAGLFFGCAGDVADPFPDYEIEILSGANQTGGAGDALADPVVIRVLENGRPVANQDVVWRVIEGGGIAEESVTRTNSDGVAMVTWRLGLGSGTQLLLATSGTGSVTVRATGIFRYADISVGYQHACILSQQGEASCWGDNSNYQLGDGTNTPAAKPVRVNTNVRFRKISAGWSHTCGISVEGSSFCWGNNAVGQLGQPLSISGSGLPLPAAAGSGLIDISAGFVHTCGVTVSGFAACWGSDGRGQLGADVQVGRLKQISAGEFHTCGVRDDAITVCWGWNSNGQTGTNSPLGAVIAPASTWFGAFTNVSAGLRHSCGVHTNGQAWCWGGNATGENGQEPGIQISVPAAVVSAPTFSMVTTGNVHSCGLSDGFAFCWGVGHGRTPVQISSTHAFSKIDAGYDRTCGIAEGIVWCWSAGSMIMEKIGSP